MKFCSACKIEKDFSCFGKDKYTSTGYTTACKLCRKESLKKWNLENKEYYRLYNNAWKKKNPERAKINKQRDYYKHKEKRNATTKKHRENNREKYTIYYREYTRKKEQTNALYKLKRRLRTRLFIAIRNNQKSGSAVKDLGCSIEELKIHLEKQFKNNMSWNNYGTSWHIDHIKPLVCFDLTNREQFLEACHYTNLQPLWAKDNLSKGAKFYD